MMATTKNTPEKTAAEAGAEAKAEKAVTKAPKKPEFYVAPRCAVTTKRGVLSGDTQDEIKASDLEGGQEALQQFVNAGLVLKG